MPLALHNTLSRRVEPFVPLDPDRVTFYTCGPTVYDYAHIGNFRAFLVADLLRRWLESPLCRRVDEQGRPLEAFGYTVRHVMNITDVGHMTEDDALDGGGEDRMVVAGRRLAKAKKEGKLPPGVDVDPDDPFAIADFYLEAFKQDATVLGLRVVEEAKEDPSLLPRATEHIGPMLEMVAQLLEKGFAYVTEEGACCFDVQRFPRYGALSGNTLEQLRAGAGGRVDAQALARKRHPADFLLWKADPQHVMRWDPAAFLGAERAAKLGLREGYPGWHIECSAMALETLDGERSQIDLHSGGEDNIFPHHECEIAQSCCATGSDVFARCWVHVRHLFVEGEKMSKSRGNFYTLRDLVARGFSPGAIRLELVRTHYRANANFTEQGLRDAERMLARWRRFLDSADDGGAAAADQLRTDIAQAPIPEPARRARQAFTEAMNDDLNVAAALGAVNAWISEVEAPSPEDAALLRVFDEALGALQRPSLEEAQRRLGGDGAPAGEQGLSDEAIEALLAQREAARRARDFATADRIRDQLAAQGVEVMDSPKGPTWRRVARLSSSG